MKHGTEGLVVRWPHIQSHPFFDHPNFKKSAELAFGFASLTAVTYPVVSTYQQNVVKLGEALEKVNEALAKRGEALAKVGEVLVLV